MNFANLMTNVVKTLKSNAPEILTGFAVTGVVATAYLSDQAGKSVARDEDAPPYMSAKEKIQRHWKHYIPPVLSGVATIGCVFGASRGHSARTAAAVTAYSITEKAFTEYKEKVVEQVGKGKEQKVRDEIAQDKVLRSQSESKEVMVVTGGDVMCFELFTGRYFRSDMETLRKAMNDINAKLHREMYVTLSDFYYLIGLPETSVSSNLGWNADRQMELHFSTVLTDDGKPCLAFEYNYPVSIR